MFAPRSKGGAGQGELGSYGGEAVAGVDCSTMTGKVLCGYQGWFTAPGDGAKLGWSHYDNHGKFEPGNCSIDFWPDTSELGESEKYRTAFQNADGTPAYVFSSHNAATVERHFRWMKEYGIDGVFVQRFAVETFAPDHLRHANAVLANCRAGANLNGRAYAVMYDLSGLSAGEIERVIDDWKMLVERGRIGHDRQDHAYLHHNGKPVVAVWGIGFNDGRKYSLTECEKLVRFLKDDPTYGGCTVMVGVPTGWRTLDRDCVHDEQVHEIVRAADIVSPWTVGRYANLSQVEEHAERDLKSDVEWCRKNGKEYLPVVFPGFSWHNMKPDAPLDQIPRLKGAFLWAKIARPSAAGARWFTRRCSTR